MPPHGRAPASLNVCREIIGDDVLSAYTPPTMEERMARRARMCDFHELIELLDDRMDLDGTTDDDLSILTAAIKAYVEVHPGHWIPLATGCNWPTPMVGSSIRSHERRCRRQSPGVEAFRRKHARLLQIAALDVGTTLWMVQAAPSRFWSCDALRLIDKKILTMAGFADFQEALFQTAFVKPGLTSGPCATVLPHIPVEFCSFERVRRFLLRISQAEWRNEIHPNTMAAVARKFFPTLFGTGGTYKGAPLSFEEMHAVFATLTKETKLIGDEYGVVLALSDFVGCAIHRAPEAETVQVDPNWFLSLFPGPVWSGVHSHLDLFFSTWRPYRLHHSITSCVRTTVNIASYFRLTKQITATNGRLAVLLAHRFPSILALAAEAIPDFDRGRVPWYSAAVRMAVSTMSESEYTLNHEAPPLGDARFLQSDPFRHPDKLYAARLATIFSWPPQLWASETIALLKRVLPDIRIADASGTAHREELSLWMREAMLEAVLDPVSTTLAVRVNEILSELVQRPADEFTIEKLFMDRPVLFLLAAPPRVLPAVATATDFILPATMLQNPSNGTHTSGYGVLYTVFTTQMYTLARCLLEDAAEFVQRAFNPLPLAYLFLRAGCFASPPAAECKRLFLKWLTSAEKRSRCCIASRVSCFNPWNRLNPNQHHLNPPDVTPWVAVPPWLRKSIIDDTAFTDELAIHCPGVVLTAPLEIQTSNLNAVVAALDVVKREDRIVKHIMDTALLDHPQVLTATLANSRTVEWALPHAMARASSDAERVALACQLITDSSFPESVLVNVEQLLPLTVRTAPQYISAAMPVLGPSKVIERAQGQANGISGILVSLWDISYLVHGGGRANDGRSIPSPFSLPTMASLFAEKTRVEKRCLILAAKGFLEHLEWELRAMCTPEILLDVFRRMPRPPAPFGAQPQVWCELRLHRSFPTNETTRAMRLVCEGDLGDESAVPKPLFSRTDPGEIATIFDYLKQLSDALGEILRIRPGWCAHPGRGVRPSHANAVPAVCWHGVQVFSRPPSHGGRRELHAWVVVGGKTVQVTLPPSLDEELQRVKRKVAIVGVLTTGDDNRKAPKRLVTQTSDISAWSRAKIYDYSTAFHGLKDHDRLLFEPTTPTPKLFFKATVLSNWAGTSIAPATRAIDGTNAFIGGVSFVGECEVRIQNCNEMQPLQQIATRINNFLLSCPLQAESLVEMHGEMCNDEDAPAFTLADAAASMEKNMRRVVSVRKKRKLSAAAAATAAAPSKVARQSDDDAIDEDEDDSSDED